MHRAKCEPLVQVARVSSLVARRKALVARRLVARRIWSLLEMQVARLAQAARISLDANRMSSLEEYRSLLRKIGLFCRALLQKRPMFLGSLKHVHEREPQPDPAVSVRQGHAVTYLSSRTEFQTSLELVL